MFEISELKAKKLPELQELAKTLKVPKYRSLKKLDLVYQILDYQATNPKAVKAVAVEEKALDNPAKQPVRIMAEVATERQENKPQHKQVQREKQHRNPRSDHRDDRDPQDKHHQNVQQKAGQPNKTHVDKRGDDKRDKDSSKTGGENKQKQQQHKTGHKKQVHNARSSTKNGIRTVEIDIVNPILNLKALLKVKESLTLCRTVMVS